MGVESREHHQAPEVLTSMLLFQLLRVFHGNVDVFNRPKVLASVALDNDCVPGLDLEASVLRNVEDVGTFAFERHDVKDFRRSRVNIRNCERIVSFGCGFAEVTAM